MNKQAFDHIYTTAERHFNNAREAWSKSAYAGRKSGFIQFGQSDWQRGLNILKEASITYDEYKLWEDAKHGYVWSE